MGMITINNETYIEIKTLDDIFDSMCDYGELYNSYLEARKGKRYRDEVMIFSSNLEGNLFNIQDDLIAETYEIGKYRPFYVYIPKVRIVMALPFRDRIVQWNIYRHINPFYNKMMIEDSYACRVRKGSHRAAAKLQYWLSYVSRKPKQWYYLKLDISKYFYRVDHAVLIEILGRRIKDERFLNLLTKIINSESQKFGLPSGMSPEECTEDMWLTDVGMPIGNLTSQLFANIYLNELDQYCKHQLGLPYYIRYMDDIIILSDNKKELGYIKDKVELFLKDELHLDLSPKKTIIEPISLGIEFVGYRIWATHRKLKKSTANRIIKNVKRLSKELAAGNISLEEYYRTAASYNDILQHCNSHGLSEKLNGFFKTAIALIENNPEYNEYKVLQ